MLNKELENIGLKNEEIKTFIFLLENPNQTVGAIAKKTGLTRPSVYGFLKNLQEKGLVRQSQKTGVKVFAPSPQERIAMVFDDRMKEIAQTKKAVQEAFAVIQKGNNPTSAPRLQIFEGKKEMQHQTKDMLLHRDIEVQSYWPIKKMIEVLGEDFFREFNRERVKRNIYINVVWPKKQTVDMKKHPYMGAGGDFLREIRIAPEEIDFSMGYWIYENKVSIVSSQKSNFGFIIENQEFADMLASQFKVMWKLSKKMDVSEKESEQLFKEMQK